jgi:hypothetical protein
MKTWSLILIYVNSGKNKYFNDQVVFIPDCSENDATICCWTTGSTRVELAVVSPTETDDAWVESPAGTATGSVRTR